MKDHLLQQLRGAPPDQRRNLSREYLQIYLLRLMHEAGASSKVAFIGGTALRLLYRMPRFSEDLDFSATPRGGPLDAEGLFRAMKRALELAGYAVTVKAKPRPPVVNAFFRFDGLPREGGWTTDPRLGLSIKVEADLAPPSGAKVETTLIQRFFPVALVHHDLASLFAGKLHALLARPHPKGRDWFDLVWYLTEQRGLLPNLPLLANALAQTGHRGLAAPRWREHVRARLHALDWGLVIRDLKPFVEREADLEQLSPALIEKLLAR